MLLLICIILIITILYILKTKFKIIIPKRIKIISILLFLMFSLSISIYLHFTTNSNYYIIKDYILSQASSKVVTIEPTSTNNQNNSIPPKVNRIAWNDRYIIAEQYELMNWNEPHAPKILNIDKINYWILDTEVRVAMGPYDIRTFESELKRLDLTDLKLKKVGHYWKQKPYTG